MKRSMSGKLTRRDALKLGTGAAISVATPLLASAAQQSKPAVVSRDAASDSLEEITFFRAVDILEAIRKKKISSREVMQAHLKQIRRLNGKLNAFVTLVPEDELMAQAAAADEALAKGNWLGPLHGLPIGVKDLHETKGIRTTYGSLVRKDFIPDFDCRVVQREKNAGGIVIGKTN